MAQTTDLTLSVSNVVSSTSFVSSSVSYEQPKNMNVTAVTRSGNQITFTGSGFPTSSFIGRASIEGINADQVIVNSATSVTASWSSTGIPQTSSVPKLSFEHTSAYVHYATVDSSITFSSVQDVTSSTAISSSFNGGMKYTIVSDGLYATLKNAQNEVKVCGSTC